MTDPIPPCTKPKHDWQILDKDESSGSRTDVSRCVNCDTTRRRVFESGPNFVCMAGTYKPDGKRIQVAQPSPYILTLSMADIESRMGRPEILDDNDRAMIFDYVKEHMQKSYWDMIDAALQEWHKPNTEGAA